MKKITIDSVYPKGPVYPVLMRFPNGYPNEDFESECAISQNNGSKTFVTEIDGIVYHGKEDNEDLGTKLILARDRTTGKVRLIEVGCAEMIPYREVDLNASQQQETGRLELSGKFGSKKQKKLREQRDKFKVNVQTVEKQMEKVTAAANVRMLQCDTKE